MVDHTWAHIGMFLVFCIPWFYFSYCTLKMCQRVGYQPSFLVWLPFLHFVPFFRAISVNPWWTLLLAPLPFLYPIALFYVWYRLTEMQGKNPWWALLMFFPGVQFFVAAYLAFV